jgi:hypothetical protein
MVYSNDKDNGDNSLATEMHMILNDQNPREKKVPDFEYL